MSDMFDKAFEEASLTQLTPNQRRLYEEGMRESRDSAQCIRVC